MEGESAISKAYPSSQGGEGGLCAVTPFLPVSQEDLLLEVSLSQIWLVVQCQVDDRKEVNKSRPRPGQIVPNICN